MKRKENYLSRDFRETAALRFPAQVKELNTAFDMSLLRHLHRIRLPGAVPLLLRQRRHQLYRAASEADLGEKHDAGAWK